MNDNIIVECSINVNIAIAVDYFVNINIYFSKSLAVLRFCWRLRVTFYKEVGPLWGHIYKAFEMKGLRKILRVSRTAKKTNEWVLNKAGVKRELLDTVKARKL